MFRVGLYARVSTHVQKTLPLQLSTMRKYAAKRGSEIALQTKEFGFGALARIRPAASWSMFCGHMS